MLLAPPLIPSWGYLEGLTSDKALARPPLYTPNHEGRAHLVGFKLPFGQMWQRSVDTQVLWPFFRLNPKLDNQLGDPCWINHPPSGNSVPVSLDLHLSSSERRWWGGKPAAVLQEINFYPCSDQSWLSERIKLSKLLLLGRSAALNPDEK